MDPRVSATASGLLRPGMTKAWRPRHPRAVPPSTNVTVPPHHQAKGAPPSHLVILGRSRSEANCADPEANFVKKLQPSFRNVDYRIGTIPNLHSLIPMSQSAHKPIFGLKAKDGVRGAHFNKVKDAEAIFEAVADRIVENLEAMG